MTFPEKFKFSEHAEREILKMLESHGFSLPHDEWLTLKLHDIASDYQWSTWRRNKDTHEANIREWRKVQDAVSLTISYLNREGPELYYPTVLNDRPGAMDAWSDDLETPLSEEELEKYLVPAEFTQGDIETSQRVLQRLHRSATEMADDLENWLEGRPVKNEQPEINGLIRGLTRLWCVAFRIPVAHVRLSASAGSPVMNFIEASVQLFLGKTPSRASIETHVIAYREEEKVKMS